MVDDRLERPARVLDTQERVAEVLFGLIMALSFTGAIQVTMAGDGEADGGEVRAILAAAIGCNIAWGLVDAVMFLVQRLVDRGRLVSVSRAFLAATDEAAQRRMLEREVPAEVVKALDQAGIDRLRRSLPHLLPARVWITGEDLRGAAAVFLLVVLATFPVVLPYLFVSDLWTAKRTSNAIALVMLFGCGHLLGRYAGSRPVWLGFAMVGIGVSLVAATMLLGG